MKVLENAPGHSAMEDGDMCATSAGDLSPAARTHQQVRQDVVAELIARLRTLRTVYNECARAIEIHCHQVTYWAEQVVPHLTDEEIAGQTARSRQELLPCAASKKRLLSLLNVLKEELATYYDRLLELKKAFDRLYYAKPSKKESGSSSSQRSAAYRAIEDQLVEVRGVRFVPSDSLLWEPAEGSLGTLEEFTIVVYDPPGQPEQPAESPPGPHTTIKSPVSLLRTIFKKPLSVFSSNATPSSLFKSKSLPKLHRF